MPQHNITSWSHPDGKKIDHFTKVGPGCTWCPWLHEQKEVADELGWERYCVLWVDTILHLNYIHAPFCIGFSIVEPMRYTYQGTPIKYTTKCSSGSILHHMCHCLYCVPTCILHMLKAEYFLWIRCAPNIKVHLNVLGTQYITWVYAGWAWEQAGLGKVLEVRAGQLKVEVWAFWNVREVIFCQCMTIISHWTAKEKSSLPDISPDHGKQDIESTHNLAQHIQSSQGERGTPSYEARGGQEVGLW